MASLQKLDTILYEVQQAFLQMSLPPPSGLFDSRDENALLMASVANLAGIMVNDAHEWQSQRKQWTLTGDGAVAAFDLPDDFDRFVDDTGWSRVTNQPVYALSPQRWARIKASPSLTVSPFCRIMGNQLVFSSPPAVGDIVFEYVDANWVNDGQALGATKSKATHASDVPRFDWLLMTLAIKLKWLEQKGMSTIAAQSDFNDRLAQLMQRDVMGQVLTLSGPAPGSFRYVDGMNAPDTGYGI